MNRRAFLMTTGATVAATALTETGLAAPAAAQPTGATSALLAPWTGSRGGLPPFTRFGAADFQPAIAASMELCRAEIATIVANPHPATFENTIAALEDAGRPLNRASTMFGVYTSTMNDDAMKAVEADLSPKFAAFGDEETGMTGSYEFAAHPPADVPLDKIVQEIRGVLAHKICMLHYL